MKRIATARNYEEASNVVYVKKATQPSAGDKLIIDYGDSIKVITSKADTIISTTIESEVVVDHKDGK